MVQCRIMEQALFLLLYAEQNKNPLEKEKKVQIWFYGYAISLHSKANLHYSGHKIRNKVILKEVPVQIIYMKDLVSINVRTHLSPNLMKEFAKNIIILCTSIRGWLKHHFYHNCDYCILSSLHMHSIIGDTIFNTVLIQINSKKEIKFWLSWFHVDFFPFTVLQ